MQNVTWKVVLNKGVIYKWKREECAIPFRKASQCPSKLPLWVFKWGPIWFSILLNISFFKLPENDQLILRTVGLFCQMQTPPRRDYFTSSWVMSRQTLCQRHSKVLPPRQETGQGFRAHAKTKEIWSAKCCFREPPFRQPGLVGMRASCGQKPASTTSSWTPSTGFGCFTILPKASSAQAPTGEGLSLMLVLIYCVPLLICSG